jgi:DNA invertase Pin-like site-specific DNA recombinase
MTREKTKTTSTKRVAIYVRVDTDGGKRPGGNADLASQERQLRNFAKSRGWGIHRIYADCCSNEDAKRPAQEALLRDARREEVNAIIVRRFDRFATNVRDLVRALAEFRRLGIEFVSIQDRFDTTSPIGNQMHKILAAMVESELRVKRERAAAGLERARRHGTKSGKPVGRPRVVVSLEKIKDLKKQGLGWRRIGRQLGISPTTARRAYLKCEGVAKTRTTVLERVVRW